MNIVRFSYSLHYPDKHFLVDDEQLGELHRVNNENHGELCRTQEGRDLIEKIELECEKVAGPVTFIAYV